MSLVENLARRKHNSIELLHEIEILNQRGYNFTEIARKTDLSTQLISGILQLIKHGEERLLKAVEKREIPISIAIGISNSEDHELQHFLHEAYENKNLRGRALIKVRRLIEQRRTKGKALGRTNSKLYSKELTSASAVKIYQQETDRQKLMVKKAKLCEARLTFIISALKELFADENYVNLLRAESIDSLPKNLANQIKG